MSRRICLLFLAVFFALAVPAASLAQSSSQAQYQGVAPETSTPVTGSGGSPGAGGSAATTSNGSVTSATGTGGSNATGSGKGTTSGASGNGGSGASAPATTSGGVTVVTPEASSDTAPFSGGDFVWIILACAGLAGLGLALRRATRSPAGT
jgi:hypothetical protein